MLARVSRRLVVLLAVAASYGRASTAASVNYEMVVVGNAGNQNDTINTGTNPNYGAVPYAYRIGKYEVTIGQYAEFLNAVAKADPNGLYNTGMATDLNTTGISRAGSSGSYVYTATGPTGAVQITQATAFNRPIAIVSWFDAARFANWMSNGQPTGSQGPSTTENGAYAISGTVGVPARNTVNPNTGLPPSFYIPTENEWYKAAYYKGSGTNAGYWAYATQSDTGPNNSIGSGVNQANYYIGDYCVTQSASYSSVQNYLTDVGAFTNSPSAYGTYDQGGNVYEWNDLTGAAGSSRALRGGGWNSGASELASSGRITVDVSLETATFGFRLAAPVPEPSTYAMALAGLTCGGWHLRRRRKAKAA